jgi:exopolysaccharide biosynthesis protein
VLAETAVGILEDGRVVFFICDGRITASPGLNLVELAQVMQGIGCVDAVNFDGGGSSELVIGGQIQNSPSDGCERPVGTALMVLKK